MLLSLAPLVVVATLAWLAPGLIWAWLAYPAPDRLPRLAVGAALGLAIQVDLAAPLANTVGITWASVLLSTALSTTLAVVLGLLMRVRVVRLPSRAAARRSETRWFLALALASVAVCAAPLAGQILPDGWDPSFHSLLASSTIATGKLPTWVPYEPIASNYPYGAHVALAEISLLTGLQPHQIFGTLLSIVVPALAALQIYTIARRVWRRGPAALGAVAAYGLLGYFNSVEYGAWGGLPNALGFILVLAALEPFFAPGHTPRRVAVAAVLLSAMPLTHHHVALSAGLAFGVYVLGLLVILALRRPSSLASPAVARRASRRMLLRLASIAALAGLLAAYSFIPYLVRGTSTLGDTSVFANMHEYSGWPFEKNGVVLWIMAVAGITLALRTLWRQTFAATNILPRLALLVQRLYPRRGSGHAQLFSFLTLVGYFAAFIVGQFIFRHIVWVLYHKDETAFSPLRFLSNMTYFLALYAGPALAWLWASSHKAATAGAGVLASWQRPILRVALVVLCLSVAAESLVASNQLGPNGAGGQPQPGVMNAYLWVRAHTPADALVTDIDIADDWWAPYLTRREVVFTPLPASEDGAGYPAEKHQIFYWAFTTLRAQPRLNALAIATAGPAWVAIAHRPIVFITHTTSPDLGTLAYSSGSVNVYTSPSLLDLLGAPPSTMLPVARLRWRGQSAGAPDPSWISPAADPSAPGWTQGASGLPGPTNASWLRLQFPAPLPPGATFLCAAQDGAIIYVDGVLAPHACDTSLQPLAELSAPGAHMIAVAIERHTHATPWFDLEILAPAR